MQQLLNQLGQQTFVGGKRVVTQELPRLPKQAATTVHRFKVSLHGSKPPVWRRCEIPEYQASAAISYRGGPSSSGDGQSPGSSASRRR